MTACRARLVRVTTFITRQTKFFFDPFFANCRVHADRLNPSSPPPVFFLFRLLALCMLRVTVHQNAYGQRAFQSERIKSKQIRVSRGPPTDCWAPGKRDNSQAGRPPCDMQFGDSVSCIYVSQPTVFYFKTVQTHTHTHTHSHAARNPITLGWRNPRVIYSPSSQLLLVPLFLSITLFGSFLFLFYISFQPETLRLSV